jgi:hypothetical protein
LFRPCKQPYGQAGTRCRGSSRSARSPSRCPGTARWRGWRGAVTMSCPEQDDPRLRSSAAGQGWSPTRAIARVSGTPSISRLVIVAARAPRVPFDGSLSAMANRFIRRRRPVAPRVRGPRRIGASGLDHGPISVHEKMRDLGMTPRPPLPRPPPALPRPLARTARRTPDPDPQTPPARNRAPASPQHRARRMGIRPAPRSTGQPARRPHPDRRQLSQPHPPRLDHLPRRPGKHPAPGNTARPE